MAQKIEYRCRYCGAKSSNMCVNCSEKLKLVRIIKKMGQNFLEDIGKQRKDDKDVVGNK